MGRLDNLLFENLPKKKAGIEKTSTKKNQVIEKKSIFAALTLAAIVLIIILIFSIKYAVIKFGPDPQGICNAYIGSEKQLCLENLLAIKYISGMDVKKCSKLKINSVKEACVLQVNEKISVQQQELLSSALTLKDISLCRKAPNMKECEDAYNLANAFIANDAESCEKISDLEKSTSCKNNLLIQQSLKGEDTCELLTDETMKEDCRYTQILNEANLKKNPTLCEKLSSAEKISSCKDGFYLAQAFSQDNAEFCEKISAKAAQQSCLSNYYANKALSTGDKSFCEKINDETEKGACIGT